MLHLASRGHIASILQSHNKGTRRYTIVAAFCMIFALAILSSCGAAAGQATTTPTPIQTPAPTIAPTVVPSTSPSSAHSPTPSSTPKPVVTPQPTTPPPVQVPPILDVRPQSMSIVGHLDCTKSGTYVCQALVLSRSNATSNLRWIAYTNVPGHVVFSPASGTLAPGQSTLITIFVPFNDCTQGLFYFQGPVNTHTITWAC